MSAPFIQVIKKRAEQRTPQELQDEAFGRLNKWAMLSGSKHVSLDEVAWLGALLFAAVKGTGLFDGMQKTETRDANGARVVGVTASDGVSVADGAG